MNEESREFLMETVRTLFLNNSDGEGIGNDFLNAMTGTDDALYSFLERWEYPTAWTPELEAFANQYGETVRAPAPPPRHTRRKRAA
jgi:hypothetical protein